MTIISIITLIEKLIALAVLLQSIEMIQLQKFFADDGIWSWTILKSEYIDFKPIQLCFQKLLAFKPFLRILQFRLWAAMILLLLPSQNAFSIVLLSFLAFSTWLIAIRWRGTFNGGSDYMTFLVLMMLSIASVPQNSEKMIRACLWYIAIQTCLSIFVAGLVKLRKAQWRNGQVLQDILLKTNYSVPLFAKHLALKKWLCFLSSWTVLIFECSFPLAILNKKLALAYISIALLFHLNNFYLFGLNRFLFAWAAAYPAVYFCSRAVI